MKHPLSPIQKLFAITVAVLLAAVLPVPQASAQTDTRPFSITITEVSCLDPCKAVGLEDTGEDYPDFYAQVYINGAKQPKTPHTEDQPNVKPNWVITTDVPAPAEYVDVSIQIWDHDSTSPDDNGDVSPRDGDSNLDIRVPLVDYRWFDPHMPNGDGIDWPNACSAGDGGAHDQPAVYVCFKVDELADTDGDGLLDDWELHGYDDNHDGVIDVDLPAMGARVDHKDLFLEIDWENGREPTRTAIHAIKAAFAAAPENAGSRAAERRGYLASGADGRAGVNAPPNPDGTRGITLHVDTGGLIDPTARKGQIPGTCTDGIDNAGGSWPTDAEDADCAAMYSYLDASVEDPTGPACNPGTDAGHPDCLVGDDLGGGEELSAAPGACGLDAAFYRAKADNNFDRARRHIFRYAIIANLPATCTDRIGGHGEIGGNDFIVFNNAHDGGTIMHELGHSLNLRHGGTDHSNCKPNYVSVMNYRLQAGIPRVLGGKILDFSPPRRALDGSSRGAAPLAPLKEDALDENIPLDPTDEDNRSAFVSKAGTDVQFDLSAHPDWDGDKDDPPYDDDVTANVDSAVLSPKACLNDVEDGELTGAEDWSFISLAFRQFGDRADAAIGAPMEPVPTSAELEALHTRLNTTDLGITMTDAPDPVAAGTEVAYTLKVTNHGPNPASSVQITDTLPTGLTLTGSNAGCIGDAADVSCHLGELRAGTSRTLTIRAAVPADLVYRNGGPATITNTAQVQNLAGPDADQGNNRATASTTVVAVADLAVTGFTAIDAPEQLVIGETATVTVRSTSANDGPSTPIDAVLTTAASADPGTSVSPESADTGITALKIGQPQTTDATFEIGCSQPGEHTVRLTSRIVPADPADTDPDQSNNERTLAFELDCVVPVAINIKPGSNPNSFNTRGSEVSVAVLTTTVGEYGLPLDFDAASIDPLTVRFGSRELVYPNLGGATETHQTGHLEDAFERGDVETIRDGDLDMVLHFAPAETGLNPADTEACVKGSFTDPGSGETYRFFGCDAVRIVR